MEMLPHADSVVRGLVPGILDIAGMSERAEELRKIDMLSCLCGLDQVFQTFQDIKDSEIPLAWAKTVEDVMFWAEAALCAAATGNDALFKICEARIYFSVESGMSSLNVH